MDCGDRARSLQRDGVLTMAKTTKPAEMLSLPQLPDGRAYLTRQMLADNPKLAEKVRGDLAWAEDPAIDIMVAPYPGPMSVPAG